MLGGYSPDGQPRGGPVVTIAAAFKARGVKTSFTAGVGGGVGAEVKDGATPRTLKSSCL